MRQPDGTIIRRNRKCYLSNPSIPAPGTVSRTRKRQVGKEKFGHFVTMDQHSLGPPGVASFFELQELDATQFVKVYAGLMDKMYRLTKAGLSVFAAVFCAVRESQDEDQIILTYEQMLPLLGRKISRGTFFRGLGELVKEEILYPSIADGLYFIDVTCLFNGDRFQLIKMHYLKGTKPPEIPEHGSKQQSLAFEPEQEKQEEAA